MGAHAPTGGIAVAARWLAALVAALTLPMLLAATARGNPVNVTTTADSDDGTCTVSLCSLRDAVKYSSAGDTVVVPSSASHYSVTLGEIPVPHNLTIDGGGPAGSIIDAGGNSRVFNADSGLTVTLQDLRITGGKSTDIGGAGWLGSTTGTVTLSNTQIDHNTAAFTATAIATPAGAGVADGHVTLNNNSTVDHNTLTLNTAGFCCTGGGGIYGGSVTLNSSSVSSNTATITNTASSDCCDGGGGIYTNGGNISVDAGSHVDGNTLTLNGPNPSSDSTSGCCSGGGGIMNDGPSSMSVAGSVSNNTVSVTSGNCCFGGGGIYMTADEGPDAITLTGAVMSGNSVTFNGPTNTEPSDAHCCVGGGAIYTPTGLKATDSVFSGDSVTATAGDCCYGGGAVYAIHPNSPTQGEPATISGSRFHANTVTVNGSGSQSGGGGMYFSDHAGALTLTTSLLDGNQVSATGTTASGGGALAVGGSASDAYANDTITGNSSTATNPGQGGGGVMRGVDGSDPNGPGTDTFANVTLAGNSAPNGSGGGILNGGSTEKFKNSIVALNTAAAGAQCAGVTVSTHSPTLTSLGHNLESSPDSCGLSAAGDRVVSASAVGLAPLANNGGPTLTRALLPGSPAIDGGDPAGCTDALGAPLTADQRGQKRPDHSETTCDIGAFEFQDDITPPTISMVTPSNGVHYTQGQKVLASYSCSDPDGPVDVALCAGPAPSGGAIDTSTTGLHAFTVQAADKAGNASTKTVHYTVDSTEATPPAISGFPPSQGCVVPKGTRSFKIKVHPTALKRAVVFLDGKQVFVSKTPKFTLTLKTGQLKPGRHKLLVVRTYKSGTKRKSTFSFSVCRGGGRSPGISTVGLPDRGRCTAQPFKVSATVTGATLSSIAVRLDGKPFLKPGKSKFTVRVGVAKLKPGHHTLVISAADRFKNASVSLTDFVRCG